MLILGKLFRYFSLLLFVLLIDACSSYRPLLDVTVTEFNACTGPDKSGIPFGIAETFSSETDLIYACGHLEANRTPLLITVDWEYEGKTLFVDHVEGVEDYFYSTYKPPDGDYLEGNYTLFAIGGKKILQQTDFRIE